MLIAALTLGYLSYRSGNALIAKTAMTFETSNRVLGEKLIDRIEKQIIDTDRAFFRLVRLEQPSEFRELWRRIVKISPSVEGVIVLNDQIEIVHLVANMAKQKTKGFRTLLETQIIPEMELSKLPVETHRHLNKTYNNKNYLLSFIRQQTNDKTYFIVLSISVNTLVKDIFPQEFDRLGETYRVSVFNEKGKVIYGEPALFEEPYSFNAHFPTTLYKWRLQISPREGLALRKQAKKRSVTDLIFVIGSVLVILVGLVVVIIAIRNERRANQLKSEFIANVSHELKTPLSLIRMFGELISLRRSQDPKVVKEYAEIIMKESDRLTSLIENVLDFARLERGKVAYSMEVGDLRIVVEHALALFNYRVEQSGIELKQDLHDVPSTIFDESALTLVVLNLVENALKYGVRDEEKRVIVSLTLQEEHIALKVEDFGPGISPNDTRRIFDRFYRGETAGGRRGSGIGLSLVKHIVEAHDGVVRLENDRPVGACFIILLPVKMPEEDVVDSI